MSNGSEQTNNRKHVHYLNIFRQQLSYIFTIIYVFFFFLDKVINIKMYKLQTDVGMFVDQDISVKWRDIVVHSISYFSLLLVSATGLRPCWNTTFECLVEQIHLYPSMLFWWCLLLNCQAMMNDKDAHTYTYTHYNHHHFNIRFPTLEWVGWFDRTWRAAGLHRARSQLWHDFYGSMPLMRLINNLQDRKRIREGKSPFN